jgi:hypothetical protein
MNKVEIIAKKSSLTQIIIKYCNIIQQQYGFKVAIIYINKEISFISKFNK